MFKRILVPTDGSPFSQDATRRAVSFAKDANACIFAIHVTPKYPVSYYTEGMAFSSSPAGKFEELAERESQEILDFVDQRCRDADVNCTRLTVSSDLVYEAIIEAARANDCDLIFMASHGRRGLNALLLGSETHKVLTHSKIPVLVSR